MVDEAVVLKSDVVVAEVVVDLSIVIPPRIVEDEVV